MSNDERIQKYLEYMKDNQRRYEEYSSIVKFIIETLLTSNDIKYQSIQVRAKAINSLANKLKLNPILLSKGKECADIQDLAGCRIVFYLESDLKRFVAYAIEEFEVIEDPKLTYSPDGYNDFKIIVKLNENRIKLPEYNKYNGLICEIQLTTALYQAWAEMNHDIIYKPREDIKNFDEKSYKDLDDKFKEAMKYLKSASYIFEYVAKQNRYIIEGKNVFSEESLKSLMNSISLNNIYDGLETLKDNIDRFGDKAPEGISTIKLLKQLIEKANNMPVEPRKTAFGDLDGRMFTDVVLKVIELVIQIRYKEIEQVLAFLLALSINNDQKISTKANEGLRKLSEFNYNVLMQVGFIVQDKILDYISGMNLEELLKYLSALSTITKELLQPTFEGVNSKNYKSIRFISGILSPDEAIIKIRSGTLDLLFNLYNHCSLLEDKLVILQCINKASRTSVHGTNQDFEFLITSNIDVIISFYLSILARAEKEEIKQIEKQSFWFSKRFSVSLKNLQTLKNAIKKDDDYQFFKLFIGSSTNFYEDYDWNKADDFRSSEIDKFRSEINSNNFYLFMDKIKLLTKNYSIKHDHDYQLFRKFLSDLSRAKPTIALKIIKEYENTIKPFIQNIFLGLWESEKHCLAKNLLIKKAKDSQYILDIARILKFCKPISIELYQIVVHIALKRKDAEVLTSLVYSLDASFSGEKALQEYFLLVIQELSNLKDFSWVHSYFARENSIINSLTESQAKNLLKSLVACPRIEYHFEDLLIPVAERYPLIIIGFFKQRVRYSEKQNGFTSSYDVIPYDFYKLHQSLENHAKIIIPEIINWFQLKTKSLHYYIGQLIEAIFPEFHPELEKQLIDFIKKEDEKASNVVLSIIEHYEGQPFVYNVCIEVIKKYGASSEIAKDLYRILSRTGVVSGEYGFVNAYKNKKESIQYLKKDHNSEVVKFARGYEKYLEKRITYESKSAEEHIAAMKIQYGEEVVDLEMDKEIEDET